MPAKLTSTELLRRYVDGRLTAPQEAELERRAATDTELGVALTALREQPEADHAGHVANLVRRAGTQVQSSPKKGIVRPIRRYAVAATLLLLVLATALVLPRLMNTAASDLALRTEAPARPATAEAAPEPEVTTEVAELEEEVAVEAVTPPPPPTPQPAPAVEPRAEADVPEEIVEPVAAARKTEAAPAAAAPQLSRERTEAILLDRTDDLRAGNAMPAAVPMPTYLNGRITDASNRPLPGALVRLPGLPTGERTDSNGVFRLSVDATLSRILVSAPGYEAEEIDISAPDEELQISLEAEPVPAAADEFGNSAAVTTIYMDEVTGLPRFATPPIARPAEGYDTLRRRLERDAPAGLEAGKVRVSFLVNPDGSLTDFRFRGDPSRAVMDYVGQALVETSSWNVGNANEPVRVHFKLRLR